MPDYTSRLLLPKPRGNEAVSREAHNALIERIDAAAATKAELDELKASASAPPAWKDLTLQNGWTVAEGRTPQYAVVGQTVIFRGAMGGGYPGTNNDYLPAFTLPAEARPAMVGVFILGGLGTWSWMRVHALTDGRVSVTATMNNLWGGAVDLSGLTLRIR